MKYLTFLILLISCAPKPTATIVTNWQSPINNKHTVNVGIDNIFGNLMQFAFIKSGAIKNQFKNETTATIIIEIPNSPVSYIDRKTKNIVDTAALLVVSLERRVSNRIYVYPKEATIQVAILLNKNKDGGTDVTINIHNTCILTAWVENNYLEKRRQLKNVPAKSTGRLENDIRNFITSL